MTRTEARRAARRMLKAGFHSPQIIEDFESGEIRVSAANRCWMDRSVTSLLELDELLFRETTRYD